MRRFSLEKLVLALTAVAMLILSSGSLNADAYTQGRQQKVPAWSQSHQGFIALMTLIGQQYNQGKISRDEANKIFNLASRRMTPDDLLRQMAERYSADEDYKALVSSLEISIDDSNTTQDVGSECAMYASGTVYGCMMSGGAAIGTDCIELADRAYCECIGGSYGGGGFCIAY
ncbi:MAG TPA: hypothetical protein VJX74_14775 [Blastocatellia bacterium]|nr:hypothetical protein [Blastocatellia bacterium]